MTQIDLYEHEGLSKEEADEISFFPTLEDEAAALEAQLAECQEKYEQAYIVNSDELDLWLKVHDYAREKEQEADDLRERDYWQGVKDGLRKARAIILGEPKWGTVADTSKGAERYGTLSKQS